MDAANTGTAEIIPTSLQHLTPQASLWQFALRSQDGQSWVPLPWQSCMAAAWLDASAAPTGASATANATNPAKMVR